MQTHATFIIFTQQILFVIFTMSQSKITKPSDLWEEFTVTCYLYFYRARCYQTKFLSHTNHVTSAFANRNLELHLTSACATFDPSMHVQTSQLSSIEIIKGGNIVCYKHYTTHFNLSKSCPSH